MHKVARLCWNEQRWTRPTGRDGKSRNPKSYEHLHGHGLEEWLFDLEKVVDGYHYAYVQGVVALRDSGHAQPFDLSLYTIDSRDKTRWWVGTIRAVALVDASESKAVFKHYRERGWLAQMVGQLKSVGIDPAAFSREVKPDILAVLKFRLSDLELLDEPRQFAHGDNAVRADYYKLKNYAGEPGATVARGRPAFVPGHRPHAKKGRVFYAARDADIRDAHIDLQNELNRQLLAEFGKSNVRTEYPTGAGSRVDAAVQEEGGKLALYEIKIGLTARACVREALGQLLEYRQVIGPADVTRMTIVSPHPATDDIERYLEQLRRQHRLPLYYRQCCLPSGKGDSD